MRIPKNALLHHVTASEDTRYALRSVVIDGEKIWSTDGRRLLEITVPGLELSKEPITIRAADLQLVKHLTTDEVDIELKGHLGNTRLHLREAPLTRGATKHLCEVIVPLVSDAKIPDRSGVMRTDDADAYTVSVKPELLAGLLSCFAELGHDAVEIRFAPGDSSDKKIIIVAPGGAVRAAMMPRAG